MGEYISGRKDTGKYKHCLILNMILMAVSIVLILEKNSHWSVVADDLEMVVMFYIHEIMVAKEIEIKSCKCNKDES